MLANLTRVESPRNIDETRDMTETSLYSIAGESAKLIVGLRTGGEISKVLTVKSQTEEYFYI